RPAVVVDETHGSRPPMLVALVPPFDCGVDHVMAVAEYIGLDEIVLSHDRFGWKPAAVDFRRHTFDGDACLCQFPQRRVGGIEARDCFWCRFFGRCRSRHSGPRLAWLNGPAGNLFLHFDANFPVIGQCIRTSQGCLARRILSRVGPMRIGAVAFGSRRLETDLFRRWGGREISTCSRKCGPKVPPSSSNPSVKRGATTSRWPSSADR